jgi:hypothetical protein
MAAEVSASTVMALTPSPDDSAQLIGGIYTVDFAHPLPGAGGSLAAFAVTDRHGGRGGLMALPCAAGAPPRVAAIAALNGWMLDGMLVPLAHGAVRGPAGKDVWCVISTAPPGPSLAATPRSWSEAELLDRVLRPAAEVLVALEQRRLTHRAINPANLFAAGPAAPAVLGCAWAAPPAMHQSAVYEPPYSAMCLPAGRGDGSIADDVYALGVTLVALALGREPLEGLDPVAILRRKLAFGSYAALVGEARLPAAIGDLVRGMLAEDPEHRPPPTLLADPGAARARRVAARPPRRGQRALEVGTERVWDARSLAFVLANDPEEGGRLLRGGSIDRWLRRSLGDSATAVHIDEAGRLWASESLLDPVRADAALVTRAVAALDPLAPLCWRGIAFWPDGLGPLLASADGPAGDATLSERLTGLVSGEIISQWAALRPERSDPMALRLYARQLHGMLDGRGLSGGLARLRYTLNPALPCASPLLEGTLVARLTDLLAALERAAGDPERRHGQPIDREVGAFIAARHDQRLEAALAGIAEDSSGEQMLLAQLRVLAELQQRVDGRPLPALASWLAERAGPILAGWHNRSRREALEQALGGLARAGQIGPMLGLLDNPAARAADANGFRAATEAARRIDASLAALAAGAPARAATAAWLGREVALAVAMVTLTVAIVAALLA